MVVQRAERAGMKSPRGHRVEGGAIPQEIQRTPRIKGGERPAWKQQAARGTLPRCSEVRTYLKGKGVNRPEHNLKDCSAVLLRDRNLQGLLKPAGKRRTDTPEARPEKFRYFSDESRVDPLPPASGIRVLSRSQPREQEMCEARHQAARLRSNSGYVLHAPYAPSYSDGDVANYRRSRRAVSESPGAQIRSGSLHGSDGGSVRRGGGKNFTCRPVEVGIFDKEDASFRKPRYASPHPTSQRQSRAREERQFMPCNYREKGFLTSSREGSAHAFAKAGLTHRPAGSLITAWNISEEVPKVSQTTGSKKKTAGSGEASPCPWGVGRRLSTTKYGHP